MPHRIAGPEISDTEITEWRHSLQDGKLKKRVAVGGKAFVTATKETFRVKGERRAVIGGDRIYELRKSLPAYKGIFRHKKEVPRHQNESFSKNND